MERGSSDVSAFISISMLLTVSFFSAKNTPDVIDCIPLAFVLFSGLGILFWWRKSLSLKYLEKLKARELEALQASILEKEQELEHLRQQNAALSTIIHKDNKLIPAMEFAVRQVLGVAGARDLLAPLEVLSRERVGIVHSYELESKRLPKTGVTSTDTVLQYMLQKATAHGTSFELSVSGNVCDLVNNTMSEADFNTLLADLMDNAILAAEKASIQRVLVNIGAPGSVFSVDVYDSGAPFAEEVLDSAGLRRATTRGNEGGSGIGLMSTFDILSRYNASFIIDETIHDQHFTKKVSVCFDTLRQYRVTTLQATRIELLDREPDVCRVS